MRKVVPGGPDLFGHMLFRAVIFDSPQWRLRFAGGQPGVCGCCLNCPFFLRAV
jgi:hypothetical protein